MVIFKGKYLNYESGTIYGMSERGSRAFSFLAETLSKLCQPWLPLVTAPGWVLIPL